MLLHGGDPRVLKKDRIIKKKTICRNKIFKTKIKMGISENNYMYVYLKKHKQAGNVSRINETQV